MHMALKKHAAFLWSKALAAEPGLVTGPRQNIAKRHSRQLCYRFLLDPLQTTKCAKQHGAPLIRKHRAPEYNSLARKRGVQGSGSIRKKWLALCLAAWRLDR
ncbi:hypothetical protein H0G86_006701 [Trichoderma simmonsii]|uniref:Uncharacterized protein n=1 Tax=Trichoderma simmonsii TaxID=1491479 RepID=A0A8G0LC22_9HYPO|nr:hypothetical protein H0G86_006701 [Trichoderma simmonsii]